MSVQVLSPAMIRAHGSPPKEIAEFVGLASTGDDVVSIALMRSPAGWSEPPQIAQFDEVTVVVDGTVHIDADDAFVVVGPGQAALVPAGTQVRYHTPSAATYIAVCRPAFSPSRVDRMSAEG